MQQLAKWHDKRLGLAVFAVVELAVCYGLVSLGIDRGNLWWYLLAFIFLIGGLQNLVKIALVHKK